MDTSASNDMEGKARGLIGLELAAVLGVTAVPVLFSALSGFVWRDVGAPMPFTYFVAGHLCRSVGWIALVAYVIAASGRGWAHFGVVPASLGKDLAYSLATIVGLIVAIYVANYLTWVLGFGLDVADGTEMTGPPAGPVEVALLLVILVVNALGEELVMRAYLITRLEQVLHSPWLGVLAATTLWAAYHLYQGVGGAYLIFALGLVLGVSFVMCRRLWPVVVAHACHGLFSFAQ